MLRKISQVLKKNRSSLDGSYLVLSRLLSSANIAKESTETMEELKANPFYAKYAERLAALQRESPEAFEAKLQEKNERTKKKLDAQTDFSSPSAVPKNKLTQQFYKEKKLDEVMKIDMLKEKSPVDIGLIWNSFYSGKEGVVTAMIPKDTFALIKERSAKYPVFVLPLPRSEGYEFFLCQFSGNECHFTSLINYQTYQENAPECFTIVHYPDLIDEKGIVLMKGEYDKDSLKATEAQCLANEIQLYYGKTDDNRTALLETFTNNPEGFNYTDLVNEMNSISLP